MVRGNPYCNCINNSVGQSCIWVSNCACITSPYTRLCIHMSGSCTTPYKMTAQQIVHTAQLKAPQDVFTMVHGHPVALKRKRRGQLSFSLLHCPQILGFDHYLHSFNTQVSVWIQSLESQQGWRSLMNLSLL